MPATAQQPGAVSASRVERLQAHIESIESVRAIKRLQSAYGHYVELGLWNDFADLFTDDAVTNYQQGARGKAEDPILAVGGEVVFETDAATGAQRQGHVGV